MALVATAAVVLHVQPYLESSRILRLATREHGVQSVLAKGARRTQRRFGTALDLYAEGDAQYYAKPGRDLHTLGGFEVTRARIALGGDLDRFAAAAALAELVLRFGRDESNPSWYDALVAALDAVAVAPPAAAGTAGVAGAWGVVAALGFAPAVDVCAACHAALDAERPARFSHPAGGALCAACGRLAGPGRTLPPAARAQLARWTAGGEAYQSPTADAAPEALDEPTVRAHLRLLREFLREHLTDGRPLRAFESWEGARWRGAAPAEPAAAGRVADGLAEPAA